MKIGNLDISKVMVGSDEVTAIYAGTDLVYSGGTTPPTPTFQGKWLGTYSDSHTSSAECDSSSAITNGEITLTDLESVEIGDCVTSIGNSAFSDCSSLASVTIGNGVTSIDDNAFGGCSSLTSVTIPSGVTSISDSAFYGCESLTSVTIPSGVTSISDYAFSDCSSLTSVTIPNSVTSIGGNAFRYCVNLTSATIGSGVTSIGGYAFDSCSSLTSITSNATNPPTLGNINAFNNTNDCPIYVPAASVSAYQSASGWSNYASRIQAIPL